MAIDMFHAIPHAALRVVPGGGHGPIFAGREKTEFADGALAFIDQGASPLTAGTA